jgi:hypothetical protein
MFLVSKYIASGAEDGCSNGNVSSRKDLLFLWNFHQNSNSYTIFTINLQYYISCTSVNRFSSFMFLVLSSFMFLVLSSFMFLVLSSFMFLVLSNFMFLVLSSLTGNFSRGSFRQNHVPWGRLSLWKWVPGISPGVKAAGAYGWRPTTLVPNVEMIRGLNLPWTPRATSACRGIPLLLLTFSTVKSVLVCGNKLNKIQRHSDTADLFKTAVRYFTNWLNALG